MTTNDDDRFDAWLREASAGYNALPPNAQVPREEMWRAIATARAASRAPRVSRLIRTPWTLAAAAAALLAVGIGIGRMTQTEGVSSDFSTAPDSQLPATYGVAATRHLTSAEAFVTAVRMSSYAPRDTAIQRWARDLLTDTRLLLDSPAGEDQRRRLLLEDLELVLVQVLQLEDSRTTDTNELLLDKTQQDQLLTRLRANVPAGPPARS
ncbi:MAG: hypothetical protein ACRENH_06225 [Gemmatimonadaceae bacterium]